MPKVTSANYSAIGTDFPVVTGTGNPLTKEDLFKLQAAVEEHTHDSTRGLAVRRVNTANAPASAGQIRVNADSFQWWNGSAVQTAASLTGAETLQNKSLLTPTIASLTNAQHTHQDASGGGQISVAALSDGTTGTGAVVRTTSPTMTAPTVSSGQLTLPVGSAGSPSLVFDSGNGLYSAGTDRLNFATAGVVRAEIDAGGNLGLGVTPSPWGAGTRVIQMGQRGVLFGNAVSSGLTLRENSYNDGTTERAIQTGAATIYDQISGTHNWYTAPSVVAGSAQSFTARATIAPTGTLTLTPDAGQNGLQSTGSIIVGHTQPSALVIQRNTSNGNMELSSIGGNIALQSNLGYIHPTSDNNQNLGASSLRWITVYAVAPAINTSSLKFKDPRGDLDPQRALAAVLRTPIRRFNYTGQEQVFSGYYMEEADELFTIGPDQTSPGNDVGILMGAIQSLAARIASLESA